MGQKYFENGRLETWEDQRKFKDKINDVAPTLSFKIEG